jgi:hypothetical protein
MPLDATQQQKLNTWMQGKGVRNNCPACGTRNWVGGEIINAPILVPGGGIAIGGGPSIPMIQVICDNCAYVMLFAAVPIGLVS